MNNRLNGTAGGFVLVFGVVLPFVSVLVEITTRICAETFFDPIPTPLHAALVAFVPLANFQIWRSLRKDDARHVRILLLANGVVAGVALFYTILYLAITPLAFLALPFLGIGLLPLAPHCALASALVCRGPLRQMAFDHGAPRVARLVPTMLAVVAAFALFEAPELLTRIHMRTAVFGSTAERAAAVRWLRSYGSHDAMLRACYVSGNDSGSVTNFFLSFGKPIPVEQARELYYRANGAPFTAVSRPKLGNRGLFWGDTFDAGQGGEEVAGRVHGLSLATSRIDGLVDPSEAVGYVEWTLVFRNVAPVQNEARAEVALPPGGVVSRLTLWVNGEEREAAFAGRGAVRKAYQNVVRARRDPVLVTTSGPDRVLVQCFPVPPNGGEMKVRFGVTAPLELESRERGVLVLPRILERNFADEDVRHSVWVESEGPLEGAGAALRSEGPVSGVYAVRGEVADTDLAGATAAVFVTRPGGPTEAVANDRTAGGHVRQIVTEVRPVPPSRVVLAIDGSVGMDGRAAEVADALDALPEGLEVGVVLATDEPEMIADPQPASAALATRVAERLRNASYAGGQDNALALGVAWDAAAAVENGAVVWVHGPQPVVSSEVDALRNRFVRRPDGPLLFDLSTSNGPNLIAAKLGAFERVRPVARLGTIAQDLERLFRGWRPGAIGFRYDRERVGAASTVASTGSGHLARLWAYDEVKRLIAGRDEERVAAATKLAATYRLVTPVTGAVVLETDQQYKDAGLEPGKAEGVPTIPEPEAWVLAVLAMLALAWTFRRRRVSCGPA